MRLLRHAHLTCGVLLLALSGTPAAQAENCPTSGGLIGGQSVGCCTYRGISVVTFSPTLATASQRRDQVIDEFRADHPVSQLPANFLVAIPLDEATNDLLMNDPATQGGLYDDATAFVSGFLDRPAEYAEGNGFIIGNLHTMFHEISHHWSGSFTPNYFWFGLAEGVTTGSSGLIDEDAAFCISGVVPGDRVRYSPTSTSLIVEVIDDHTLTLTGGLSLPAGTSYVIQKRMKDSVGHWRSDTFVDGSYLKNNNPSTEPIFDQPCPEDVCSAGTCIFTERTTNDFSPQDLYLMGLLTFAELEQEARPYKVEFIEGESGVPVEFQDMELFWRERNPNVYEESDGVVDLRTRFILVTTVGKRIPIAVANAVDQMRRDALVQYHRQTRERGALVTNLFTTVPDPAVAQVVAPVAVLPGETLNLTVFVHNQSGHDSQAFDLVLTIGSTVVNQQSFAALAGHELREIPLSFVMPDVFGSATTPAYQGSVTLKVALTTTLDNQAGISNERTVQLGNALGESSPSDSQPIEAGPATASDLTVIARDGGGTDSVQILHFGDPFHPVFLNEFDVPGDVVDLEGDSNQLFIGTTSSLVFHDVPFASGFAPRRTMDFTGRFVNDMALSGESIFVTTFNAALTAELLRVSGIGNPLTASSSVVASLGAVSNMRVKAIGTRLYVYGEGGRLIVYNITNPASPSQIVSSDLGDYIDDLTVGAGNKVVVAMDGDLHVLNAALTGVSSSWQSSYGGVSGVQSVGNFLIVRVTDRWQVLASPTNLSVVGELLVGGDLYAGFGTIAGWTLLADSQGVRAFSPSGVNRKFVRGDTSGNGSVSFVDIAALSQLLSGGPYPIGRGDAFDVNDSGTITIADLIKLTSYVQQGGSPPSAPFPTAGLDTTADSLPFLKPK